MKHNPLPISYGLKTLLASCLAALRVKDVLRRCPQRVTPVVASREPQNLSEEHQRRSRLGEPLGVILRSWEHPTAFPNHPAVPTSRKQIMGSKRGWVHPQTKARTPPARGEEAKFGLDPTGDRNPSGVLLGVNQGCPPAPLGAPCTS